MKDDKTAGKFGRIIHAYTMRDAVADGAVTPLLYEERVPELTINEEAVNRWFEKITAGSQMIEEPTAGTMEKAIMRTPQIRALSIPVM